MWFLALQGARETNSPVLNRRNLFFPHSRGNFGKFLCLSRWCLTFSRRLKLPTVSKGIWGPGAKDLSPGPLHWCPNSRSLCRTSQPSWEGEKCSFLCWADCCTQKYVNSSQVSTEERMMKGSSFLLFCRSHTFFIRCITPNPKKVGQYPELLTESLSSLKSSTVQQLSFCVWVGTPFLHLIALNFLSPFSVLYSSLWPCELTICWGIRRMSSVSWTPKGVLGFVSHTHREI